MELFTEDIQRILLSALLGAVIGLERQLGGKSAGFRTLMVVCIGSALFTIVSHNMALEDPFHRSDITRIASNIVTGIGFIGAGIIFKGKQNIKGLTTAATVWAAAAIGMAAGNGDYSLAIVTTVIVWIILVILDKIENGLETLAEARSYRIGYRVGSVETPLAYEDFFDHKGFKLIGSKTEKHDDMIVSTWTVRAPKKKHDTILQKLLEDERITSLHY